MLSHAAAIAEDEPGQKESIEEIVVVVDRAGNHVDIDAINLEKIRDKIIREFELEQADQEEELWRLKLRAAMKRPSSRIAWGYDAQWEAAMDRKLPATWLPIDRVMPATVINVRF